MDVKLPQLGEGADSGTVITVFVKDGDVIEQDQNILELENEKAVASIPSPEAGTITKVHVQPGAKVSAGQVILTLEKTARKEETTEKDEGKERTAEKVDSKAPREKETKGTVKTTETGDRAGLTPAAAPSVRRMARQLGLDLAQLAGALPVERITLADIRAYIQRLQKLAGREMADGPGAGTLPDFARWGPVRKEPMSAIRKVIARRMHESWTTIPHVAQFDEVDVTALVKLQKKHTPKYKRRGGTLTLTTFVLKAVVAALQKFPIFNASLDEAARQVVFKQYYHIGVAVDTEHGLIVPVLRDVDRKTLLDLALELPALAEKARQRKISPDEMKGGSFTLSNQGGIGGGFFTPIIHAPEVAILGLGRAMMKPALSNGDKIVPRLMLPCVLSYDHRIIDGGDAARFIVELGRSLQHFSEKDVQIQ